MGTLANYSMSSDSSGLQYYLPFGCCQSGNYSAFTAYNLTETPQACYIFSVAGNGSGDIAWTTSSLETEITRNVGMSESIGGNAPSILVTFTHYYNLFLSNDFGETWLHLKAPPSPYDSDVYDRFNGFVIIQEILYATVDINAIYQYDQNNDSWTLIFTSEQGTSLKALGASAPGSPPGSDVTTFIYVGYKNSSIGPGYFVNKVVSGVISGEWTDVSLKLPLESSVLKIVASGDGKVVYMLLQDNTLYQTTDGLTSGCVFKQITGVYTNVVCDYTGQYVYAVESPLGEYIYSCENGNTDDPTFTRLIIFDEAYYEGFSLGETGNLLVTVNNGLAYSLDTKNPDATLVPIQITVTDVNFIGPIDIQG